MFSKLKKHSIAFKLKAMISSLIIAFFYASFIIFVITLFAGKYVKKSLAIVNTLSLEMNIGSNEEVHYDRLKRTLEVMPSWGSEFGRIKINSIGVDIPIFHGDDVPQLATGAGHYAGSDFPGEGGTIILAAHNSRGLFYTLPQIQNGAIINVETIYGNFDYEVYNTAIADYRNTDAFFLQNEEEILILYTCYPVDNVWYVNDRFVAYAKLVGES